MNIIIKKNFIFYKGYKIKCSIGKSGVKKTKKEGDLATPQGVFSLGSVYYRKDRNFLNKSSLKKKIIKKNMGWCNDIKSEKYNKQILFPFKYSAEKLYRKDASYDIFIEIYDIYEIYKYFKTPRNYRKEIKKIKLNFAYNFDQKITTLNSIEIDGLMNQKVNQILNQFVSKDTLIQNRVYFKNLINEALKSYSG